MKLHFAPYCSTNSLACKNYVCLHLQLRSFCLSSHRVSATRILLRLLERVLAMWAKLLGSTKWVEHEAMGNTRLTISQKPKSRGRKTKKSDRLIIHKSCNQQLNYELRATLLQKLVKNSVGQGKQSLRFSKEILKNRNKDKYIFVDKIILLVINLIITKGEL